MKYTVVWPNGWTVVCTGARAGLLGLTMQASRQSVLYVRFGESSFLAHGAVARGGKRVGLRAAGAERRDPALVRGAGMQRLNLFSGGISIGGGNEAPAAEDWAASWSACHGGPYHRSYTGLGPPNAALCALQNELTGYPG
jgi:hypothetical protein